MNKEMMKMILNKIETSEDNDLFTFRDDLILLLNQATTSQLKSEVRFALKLLDEELATRALLQRKHVK